MDWDTSGSTVGISKTWERNHARARRSLAATFIGLALVVLLLAGCDSESLFGESASETSTAMRVLDASATVLVHLDVQQSLTSMEEILSQDDGISERIDEAMGEMAERLGINPREDFQHLYIALSGEESQPRMEMIAFADFDHEMMTGRLDAISELTKIESAGKTDSYRAAEIGGLSMSLVDGSMILITNQSDELDRMVNSAIDGEGMGVLDDALLRLVDKYDSWTVIRGLDQFIPDMSQAEAPTQFSQIVPVVQSVQNVALGMTANGSDVSGALFIEPAAEISADDLASILSGLRAAARLEFEDGSLVMNQLERLDISAKKGIVSISTEMEKDDIMEVFKSMGSRLQAMASSRFNQTSEEK